MNQEKIFANGIYYKPPRQGAPEFVKGSFGIKVDEFVEFLKQHKKEDGWVNLDFKKSQKGTLYFELNTWKKEEVPTIQADEQYT